MICYRQGDVLIVPIAAKPVAAFEIVEREGGRVILAEGESTGHAHAIKAKSAAMFRDPKLNAIFLSVTGKDPVALEHDEHTTIELPPGDYQVILQREYQPEGIRAVAD